MPAVAEAEVPAGEGTRSRPSAEVKAAVIAACAAGESRRAVARRFGLTPGQVMGLWHRRPPGTEMIVPASASGPPATAENAIASMASGGTSLPQQATMAKEPAPTPAPSPRPAAAPASGPDRGPDIVDLPAAARFLPSMAAGGPVAPAVFAGAAGAVHRLRHRDCRWPIGDVGDEGFRFCCAPAEPGSTMPYCPAHRRDAIAGPWSAGRRAA